jgi:hypothetical protein
MAGNSVFDRTALSGGHEWPIWDGSALLVLQKDNVRWDF